MLPWWWVILALFMGGFMGLLIGCALRFSTQRDEAEGNNVLRLVRRQE